MDTSKIKLAAYKYNKDTDLFDLKFNVKDTLLDESVNCVAFSSNRIYVRMVEMLYDDLSTSDHILSNKDKIKKLTLIICDRSGNIKDKKDFKVKFNDLAYFDFDYANHSLSTILLVFEYDSTEV